MTLNLVWNGKGLVDAMRVLAAIFRHRKIMVGIERQGEISCGDNAGDLAEKRIERLIQEERQARSALAAMPIKDVDEMGAKASYLAELLENDAEALDADDMVAALRSFAAMAQPK